MKSLKILAFPAVFLFTLSLTSCGGSATLSPSTSAPAPQQQNPAGSQNVESAVTIKNFAFSPSALTIKKGTTVTWTNEDSVPHTIKSDTFNSGTLNTGNKFQFTFSSTGTFDYSCGIHPQMSGKIIVE
jgi:plastocyanin